MRLFAHGKLSFCSLYWKISFLKGGFFFSHCKRDSELYKSEIYVYPKLYQCHN